MSRFFFHLHECHLMTRDEEGRDFPDLETALSAAKLEARRLLAAEVAAGKLCLGCQIEVEEQSTGRVVVVPFVTAVELTGGVSVAS